MTKTFLPHSLQGRVIFRADGFLFFPGFAFIMSLELAVAAVAGEGSTHINLGSFQFFIFFILWIDYENGVGVIENVGLSCSEFDRRGGGGKPIERQ